MSQGYISIGSNIDKEIYIPASIKALSQLFGELIISSVYSSESVGFTGDSFYNLVIGFSSELTVKEVAKHLRNIELANGRTQESQKFSSRTLDLDLLLYDDLIINDGRLQIPRDEIQSYAFVLEPLAEVAPTLRHPVNGLSYAELWDRFDKSDLKQHKILPSWA
ncbi:MAG: 2-amino-4-hydroxy-6-hydroxymethyldihydropteridine diphosphokinase [Methylococcales bacterium]|nr:MAG: 2-amino-4-hydroxy-6-hydroxymethyldihydropteridine diphosphokinase [Methylococcales bacterium]